MSKSGQEIEARDIFTSFTALLSTVAALGILAYIIGWIYLRSYFSVFGAEWILLLFDPKDVLSASGEPLANLTLGMVSFATMERVFSRLPQHRNPRKSAFIFLAMLSVPAVLLVGSNAAGAAIKLFTFFAGSAVAVLLTIALSNASLNLHDKPTMMIVFSGILIGLLFIVAAGTGFASGLRDLHPIRSRLPRLAIAGQKARALHLLHGTSEKVFAVDLSLRKVYPVIEVLDWQVVQGLSSTDERRMKRSMVGWAVK